MKVWLQVVIAVECRGRLGNLMFQYAFALAAAERLGAELSIDDERLRELFLIEDSHHGGPAPGRVVSVANDAYHDPESVLSQLVDDATYVGYFQSERFFAAVRDEVRNAFRFQRTHVRAFDAKYEALRSADYVCCHMRRTDYHSFAGGVALPMSYYASALARIRPSAGTPIVFVGDDLGEAREAFGHIDSVRFEHNDEAVDLQLLNHAATVVVSNSSFAWWGAWLNARPDKRVLAPRHWLGYNFGWDYPAGVVPDDWEQIRVRQPWGRRLAPSYVRMALGRRRHGVMSRLTGR